jgi:hypothetical protein
MFRFLLNYLRRSGIKPKASALTNPTYCMDSTAEYDELFETDHVDVIDAAKSILAPAMLRAD